MNRTLLPLAALLGLGALTDAGCSASLDLVGSHYMNMRPSSVGQTGAQTTELMSVMILQLRSVPEDKRRALIEQVRAEWPQLREQSITGTGTGAQGGVLPESVKPLLAYDAKLLPVDRPMESFVVYPRASKRHTLPLSWRTSHLLVITLGHQLGPSSVQLLKASSLDPVALCFHEYDVFPGGPAELDKPWPCGRTASSAGGYR